jgi:hypothetical protein
MNKILDTRITGWFALTISPPPSMLEKTALHIKLSTIIERFLRRCSTQYAIMPELQFSTARLHYHCVYKLENKASYLKQYHTLQRIGYVHNKALTTYRDKLRWIVYLHKDAHLTREVLHPLPTPIIPNKKRVRRTQWDAVCKTNTILNDLMRSVEKSNEGEILEIN